MKWKEFLKSKGHDSLEDIEDPKELAKLNSEFQELNAKKIADLEQKASKNEGTEKELQDQKKAFEDYKAEAKKTTDDLLQKLKDQAEAIAEKEKKQTSTQSKSLLDVLKEKKEDLESLKDRQIKNVQIEYKVVATMTTGNVTPTTPGGLSMILNDPEAGITPFSRSAPFFSRLFPSSGTTGNTISYAEMVTPEGGAGMTAEGTLKSQADFNIAEKSEKVKKISAFIKTSKEALDDIDALAGEINNELITLVELKQDSQVLSGDNTGQNLNGILENATAFAAGDFALAIESANEYDVLNVAVNQIEIAEVIAGEPAGFIPNIIVLHPTDAKTMKLEKDANNNYIFPISNVSTQEIDGIPVVTTARMTKGDFLVMDTTKGNLRIRENTTISMGYENDDFTKNLITILAEKRVCFYIKSQHVKAFVTGTFSTAKAALETA